MFNIIFMLVLQYTNTLLIHSLKKKQQLPCPAVHRGLPHSSVGKESVCNAGDLGSIPVLGRSPGEENGNPFQYSCLGNHMDREAWRATVHGVTKSRI